MLRGLIRRVTGRQQLKGRDREFPAHAEVGSRLVERYGLEVRHGPFKGLLLPNEMRTRLRAVGPKLLGAYEPELERFIDAAARDSFATIINVGAAEGYYAVGLAKRTSARVIGYEADDGMRTMLRSTIAANDARAEVRGLCTTADLVSGDFEAPIFLLVDCEGCELALLDPESAPMLEQASIVVELHDFIQPGIREAIRNRFAATHDQAWAQSGATTVQRPELAELTPAEAALALDELRPVPMEWLALAPKGAAGSFAETVRAR
jgi:hypothetical protein